ncbi:hypothetical protein F4778DRAFT_793890 [Xylariomycetidae sp. FL2044]|nr:hypothetical protein F4778DRAFT_793890 [Xylariomycetidae sp. FL2044]
MQYTTALLTLLSTAATLTQAAPTTTAPKLSPRDASSPSGYIVPNLLKSHDIKGGQNWPTGETAAIRNDAYDNLVSTLYSIPVPASLAGRTCGLVFTAQPQLRDGDDVRGAMAMDVFSNGFAAGGLAALEAGNLRDRQLARIRFDAGAGAYAFDEAAFAQPAVRAFACPAGETLAWEAAPVGDFDVNLVQQSFVAEAGAVPRGLSIAWW